MSILDADYKDCAVNLIVSEVVKGVLKSGQGLQVAHGAAFGHGCKARENMVWLTNQPALSSFVFSSQLCHQR